MRNQCFYYHESPVCNPKTIPRSVSVTLMLMLLTYLLPSSFFTHIYLNLDFLFIYQDNSTPGLYFLKDRVFFSFQCLKWDLVCVTVFILGSVYEQFSGSFFPFWKLFRSTHSNFSVLQPSTQGIPKEAAVLQAKDQVFASYNFLMKMLTDSRISAVL